MAYVIPGGFVYIPHSRTGSTSMKRMLRPMSRRIKHHHDLAPYTEFNDLEVVTTCRDPVDILASWYTQYVGQCRYSQSRINVTFDQFLFEPTLRARFTQNAMLWHFHHGGKIDRIIRYWHYHDDVTELFADHGLGEPRWAHKNKGHDEDRPRVTQKHRDIVRELHPKDVKAYEAVLRANSSRWNRD